MVAPRPVPGKKYFTVSQANATLPYVRAIVRDISELAQQLRQRQERLLRLRTSRARSGPDHEEECEQAVAELERDGERMEELRTELERIGVELKDYFAGLIDFPSLLDGRPVYLCWKLGEPEVAHWHEMDAGFAGRKRLEPQAASSK